MPSAESVSPGRAIKRSLWPLAVGYALVLLTFALPRVDSTRAPYFDLAHASATAINRLSATGTMPWVVVVGVLALVIMVSRPGLSGGQRAREALVLVGLTLLTAGLGAYANENLLKEQVGVPRPNIVALAANGGLGGLSAEEFYARGDKAKRSDTLSDMLATGAPGIELAPAVREHWIAETGYSRPSGHAFAAFYFATFFLVLAASRLRGARLWLIYLLLPWAVAVCYSRPILRVHTPTDIALGAPMGMALALVGFALAERVLRRPGS